MEIVDESRFKQIIETNDGLIICSFYTDSCPNCNTLYSVFEDILLEKSISYYKINAHSNSSYAKENKIMGVPTTLFFKFGLLLDKKMGVKSKSSLMKTIEKFEGFSLSDAKEFSDKGFFSKLLGI